MAEFIYKFRDAMGRVQEAVTNADSSTMLRARLAARGYEIVDIQLKNPTGIQWREYYDKVDGLFEQVTLRDMVVFSRQFAAMVSAGVALLRTLTIIVEQCKNRKMKAALDDVRHSVEAGLSLSDAMAKQPALFDKLYISMVRAGEAGGILADILK
ncbi:MAG: type II secretion system F family protein, partial [Terriglobales bacterium]